MPGAADRRRTGCVAPNPRVFSRQIRWNILALAAIGAILVIGLAFAGGGNPDAMLAVLAIGGTLVGGLSGTMTRLTEPEPDPSVPASTLAVLLRGGGTVQPQSVTHRHLPILGLVSLAAVMVIVLLVTVPGEAALVTVAGGLVGGLVSLAGKLAAPPPDPSVPASVVRDFLARPRAGADA